MMVFQILSAILHFGNIYIKDEESETCEISVGRCGRLAYSVQCMVYRLECTVMCCISCSRQCTVCSVRHVLYIMQ